LHSIWSSYYRTVGFFQASVGGDEKQELSSLPYKVTFRGTFHALLTVLTWILFVYWWGQVIPQVSFEDAIISFLVIILTAMVTSILTLLWVRHNINIFRRKGPRKGLPTVSEERFVDHLGRTISHPGNDILKASRVVIVSSEGTGKSFEGFKSLQGCK